MIYRGVNAHVSRVTPCQVTVIFAPVLKGKLGRDYLKRIQVLLAHSSEIWLCSLINFRSDIASVILLIALKQR